MDLTIPYIFYPAALPHWMAWTLFLVAMIGGTVVGIVRGRARGWVSGGRVGLVGALGFLLLTMLVSVVITFFVHDL